MILQLETRAKKEVDLNPVINFMKGLAESEGANRYKVTFLPSGACSVGPLLVRLPALVQGENFDAFDKATVLQNLEDAWNYAEPEPEFQVILVPAGTV